MLLDSDCRRLAAATILQAAHDICAGPGRGGRWTDDYLSAVAFVNSGWFATLAEEIGIDVEKARKKLLNPKSRRLLSLPKKIFKEERRATHVRSASA